MSSYVCLLPDYANCDALDLTTEGYISLEDSDGDVWYCRELSEAEVAQCRNGPGPFMEEMKELIEDRGGILMQTAQTIIECPGEGYLLERLEASNHFQERLIPVTEKKLRRLPRWARVSFAVRCARAAQRFYPPEQVKPQQQFLEVFERAITIAERSAAAGRLEEGLLEVCQEAAYRCEAGYTSEAAVAGSTNPPMTVQAWPAAAVGAVSAAGHEPVRLSARSALSSYSLTLLVAGMSGDRSTVSELHRDFERLRDAAEQGGWTDETPVSVAFWG